MAKLGAHAPLIVTNIGEIDARAKVDREAEVFAAAMIVNARGKAGSEDDFFSEKDVNARAAEKIAIALSDSKKTNEGANAAKMHIKT